MKTITLCMIVKNEENFLEHCLNTVKEVVNEIIIVDTGSSDSTMEIAEKYNAQLFEFKWNNNFAEARNFAIDQASGDYILILDADEYIESGKGIKEDLKLCKDYYINRIKNYSSEGLVRFHEAIRLFKNNIGLRYYGRIHEHLNIHEYELTATYSKSLIHHCGYKEDVVKSKDKLQRNIQLLKIEVEENPTGYNYFNLGKQYKQMDKLDHSLESFKKSYNLSKTSNYLNELIYHIGDCLRMQSRYKEGIRVIEDGIVFFPYDTDLYFLKAKIYEEYGFLQEAEKSYLKCLEVGEKYHTTTEGVGSYLAYYNLAGIYYKLSNRLKCAEALFNCINIKKDFTSAIIFYVKVLTEVNIPNKEIQLMLTNIFSEVNIKDIKALISALYNLRHPLLMNFLNLYKYNVENNILAVSYQYCGNYLKAFEKWSLINGIEIENSKDLILLSILTRNNILFNKHQKELNLTSKELDLINKIINREQPLEIDKDFTVNFENYLCFVFEKLIMLREYSTFNFISNWIKKLSTDTQYNISQSLFNNGFFEVTLELIKFNLKSYSHNNRFKELLGDVYFRNNNFFKALELYEEILEGFPNPHIYSKVYDIYTSINDVNGIKKIVNRVNRVYNIQLI
ncbi:glycosyltransferase family 2 protein [Priestia megaterium]|uniref:glycosyltransferase family 2 protein n=1 Tax=Priestia megaterium TaxID=1404 RepID=UPI0031720AA7